MDWDPTTTFVIGAGFGAALSYISSWLFLGKRREIQYAQVAAVAAHEGTKAARETVARLVPTRDKRPTVRLKLPLTERPTDVFDSKG